ncbi:hypothetical protein LIER_05689 [Lithospermum erythrorhizon]|uniref:Uncharacterized protein n=1 Tax=Lithospermum erythrorhizon TaxID=34254 RepID=A0AAV3P2R5_LITER
MPLFPTDHIQLNQQEGGFDTAKGYKTSLSLEMPEPTLSTSNGLLIYEQQETHWINTIGVSSAGGDKEKKGFSLSLSSLDLPKHDLTEFKTCNREQEHAQEDGTGLGNLKLSTNQIIRLAGERFVEFTSHMFININANIHPYGSNLTGLTVDDKMDVELVQLILTVVEKLSHKQTDKACRLLSNCTKLASNIGRPVQRVVFYFAEALAKKIERETGKVVSNIWEAENPVGPTISSKLNYDSAILACNQKLPFSQVMRFAGVQAMLDNIKMNSKVHLIDIQMQTGVTWAVLMQALAKQEGYKVKQLKLTVIETIDKESVKAKCTHLQNFAKTLNLIFFYHIIFLSDMKDITDNQFEVEADEAIVVYAPFVLRTMIVRPHCLEILMNTMKRLNPSVMVITEYEVNHNSPSFVNRFIEALFYYSATFDCLEDCMERNDQDRMALESGIFRCGIHNIVATEGTKGVTRSVTIEVWRAFFERFGMVEVQLSESSLYQAQLVLQTFPCANSCSLGKKGKGLVVAWKGSPRCTLSAWSFS